MAIIGKIRSYGTIIIIVIGLALASFVLGDFLKPRQKNINNIKRSNGGFSQKK